MKPLSPVFLALGLLLITAFSFSPSLNNGFTNWDDQVYLTENPDVRELSWKNMGHIFTNTRQDMYRPMVTASYSVEYHFFGLNPKAYHATNLIFHLLNTLLAFWLIYLVSQNRFVALITAAFFALHPMHVESVAWVTERKDMLYAFFFLGSLVAYAYFQDQKKRRFYFLSLCLFTLSLISKPMAITLPFLLLLMDFFRRRPFTRSLLIEKIPFFVLSAGFAVSCFFMQKTSGAVSPERLTHPLGNLLSASDGLLFYLVKLIAPTRLSAIYPILENPGYWIGGGILLSPILLLIPAGAFIYGAKISRKIAFGGLFFLVTLLPVLQFIPSGFVMTADRYTYIASIGYFYVIAEGFLWLCRRLNDHPIRKRVLVPLLVLWLSALSVMTFQRCGIWKDSVTLWDDVLKKYPNVSFAYNNRANALNNSKNILSDLNQAIKLRPDFPEAHNNKANEQKLQGNFDEVLKGYDEAIRLKPDYADAYFNRAVEYTRRGQTDLAIADYRRLLQLTPDDAEACYNLANRYSSKGMSFAALEFYTRAIAIRGDYAMAYNNRGHEYSLLGDYSKAIGDYKKALQWDPELTIAKNNLAEAREACKDCG